MHGIGVAASLDELQELAVGDQARGQPIGFEEDAMARRFIVVAEVGAGMTDRDDAAGKVVPAHRRCGCGRRRPGRV